MSLLAQIAIFLAAAVIAIPIFRRLQAGLGARLPGRRHHHRPRRPGIDQQDRHHAAHRGVRHRTPDVRHRPRIAALPPVGDAQAHLRPRVGPGAGDHTGHRRGRLLCLRTNLAVRAHHRLRAVHVLHRAGPAVAGGARPAQFAVRPLGVQHPAVSGHRGAAGARAAAAAGGRRCGQNRRTRRLAGDQVRRRARHRDHRRALRAAPHAAHRRRHRRRRGLHRGGPAGRHRHRAAGEPGRARPCRWAHSSPACCWRTANSGTSSRPTSSRSRGCCWACSSSPSECPQTSDLRSRNR